MQNLAPLQLLLNSKCEQIIQMPPLILLPKLNILWVNDIENNYPFTENLLIRGFRSDFTINVVNKHMHE